MTNVSNKALLVFLYTWAIAVAANAGCNPFPVFVAPATNLFTFGYRAALMDNFGPTDTSEFPKDVAVFACSFAANGSKVIERLAC